MRALGATIASALVAVFAATSVAQAQGKIADVRFGKEADLDRVVLDLSADPVDATQTSTDDQFILELSASKPFPVYADGEHLTDLPASLRVLPRALSVLVPPTAGT